MPASFSVRVKFALVNWLPLEALGREVRKRQLHLLTDLDQRKLIFIEFRLDPERGKIGNAVEESPGLGGAPLDDGLLEDRAGGTPEMLPAGNSVISISDSFRPALK